MNQRVGNILLRLACPADAMGIAMLYQQVYEGHYTNPMMRESKLFNSFIESPGNIWVVAIDVSSSQQGVEHNQIVGSVVYEVDVEHRLAKAFGGAVLSTFRGHRVLERSMEFAESYLINETKSVDVIYATTRTATPAPQIVTEHLGYKKLGVFPNVHRTDVYETHCLAAKFSPGVLDKRFKDYRIHPRITNLYEIVRSECGLQALEIANGEDLKLDEYSRDCELEAIAAPRFVVARYNEEKAHDRLGYHFFPFHLTNLMVTSADSDVQLFCYVANADKHCTIMALKKPRHIDISDVLEKTVRILSGIGVRYIEILVRADKIKTIERVVRAKFVPSAFFPAFQLLGDKRYDFVAFSRTFEILDFSEIKLAGKNRVFLDEYIRNMQDLYLRPHTLTKDSAT